MTSHILLDEDSEHGLRCLHCYDIHSPVLPMTVERHIDECRGFVLMHKHCVKPKEPSPQLDLPHATSTNGGIDANRNDLPDPGTDPPNGYADTERERPQAPDVFASMYPMATDVPELRRQVELLLPIADASRFAEWPIPHPATGIFDAVAHWARIEHARLDSEQRAQRGEPGVGGLYIPARLPMPEALAEALGVKLGKKKRGARPLSSGKARKGKAT